MKKLLFTLMAVILGITGLQAQTTLYLRGDLNSWGTGVSKTTGESCTFTYQGDNVYTLTLSSLTGAFKIADSGWTASTNFGGNGQTTISMDKDYTLNASSSSGNLVPDANWTDVTLTFNISSRVLKVTGSQKEQVISWGLMGNFVNSSWPTIQMTETQTGSNIWECEVTPVLADCEFGLPKLADGAQIEWWTNTGATISETNTTISLSAGENNTKASLIPGRTYTFSWNANTNQLSLSWTNEVVYPSTLYVIGNVNGGTWAPNNGFQLNNTDEGVFEGEVTIGDEMATGTGYFSFTTALASGGTDDDWQKMGARYGAKDNDFTPVYDNNNTIQAGENAFVVPVGTYTMKVNLKDMTLYISAPVQEAPENLYLIGTLTEDGNWNLPGTKMVNEGDNQFVLNNVAFYETVDADGYGYFAFTSSDSDQWPTVNSFRFSPEKGDTEVEDGEEYPFVTGENGAWMVKPGIYDVYFLYDDGVVVVEYVSDLPSSVVYPETLYFAQPFGTIPAASPQTLKAVENGVYEGQIQIKTGVSYIGFYTDVNGEITKYGKGSFGSIGFGNTNAEAWPGEDTDADNNLQVNPASTMSWYMPSIPAWAPGGIFTVRVDLNTLTFTLAPPEGEFEEPAPAALYVFGNVNGYQANARYTNVATLSKQGATNVYSGTYDVPACGPFSPDGEYGPVDGAPNNGWYFFLCDNASSYTASGAKVYQAPLDNFLVSLQQGGTYTAVADANKQGNNFIVTNPGNYSFEFNFDTKDVKITLNEVAAAISLSAEVPQANVTGKTAQLNYEYTTYNASNLTNVKLNVALENVEGGNELVITEDLTATSGSIILSGLKDGITYKAAITVTANVGAVEVVSNVYTLQFTTPEIEEVTEAYLGVTSNGTFPDAPDKSKAMELVWGTLSDNVTPYYSFSGTFTLYPGQGVNVWGPSSIMTDDPENPNPYPGLQPMGPDWDEPQDLFFKTGETTLTGRLYPSLDSYWVVKNTIPVEVKIEYDQQTGFTLTCLTDVSDQVESGSGEVPDNNGMKMFIAQALRDPSGATYGNATDISPSADDVQLAYVESEGVYYGYATFANTNNQGFNRSWRVYTAEEAGVVISYYTGATATAYGGANLTFASADAVVEQNMAVPEDLKAGFSWTVQANTGFPDKATTGTVYMVIDLNNMTAKFSLSPFKFETEEEPEPESKFPDTIYLAQPFNTVPSADAQPIAALADGIYGGEITLKTGVSYIGFYTDVNGEITKYGKGSFGTISFGLTNMESWPGESDADNTLVVNPASVMSWYMPSQATWATNGNTYYVTVNLNTLTFVLSSTGSVAEGLNISNGADDTLQSTYIDEESSIVAMTVDPSKEKGLLFVNVPAGAVAEYQITQEVEGGIGGQGGLSVASVMDAYAVCPTWKGSYCIPLTPNTMGTLEVRYNLNGYVSEPQTWNFIVSPGAATGVNGIAADEEGVDYYTLDGVKVKNPERGIYIRVANGKATKVVR